MIESPIVKDLVLVGGGHSHVAVLKKFGMKPIPGLQITVINPDTRSAYSGMLPGLIAGHYTEDEIYIDMVPLCRFAGSRLFVDEVTHIDLDSQQLICKGRPSVNYDLLSIDIGITPMLADVPGAAENVIPVKPINGFLSRWQAFMQRLNSNKSPRIGIVGGGAGGVELILAIQERINKSLQNNVGNPRFELFTDTDVVLPTHNEKVQRTFMDLLEARNIKVHRGFRVQEVHEKDLISSTGDRVTLDEIFWATGAAAHAWPGDSGLAVDENGFIEVDDCLRCLSHKNVFAVGDAAVVLGHPRPKAGVFAVRQGPPLADNLRRVLLGKEVKSFRMQQRFLSLVSTGDRQAVSSWENWSVKGRSIWLWKDWIDRRFMDKYNRLPEMKTKTETHILAELDELNKDMRCGGCGAKVDADLLARVLQELKPVQREDVLLGLHGPDDAAVVRVPTDYLMLHTVDSFRSFIDDPYVFGKIAANHALTDMYAMGASPQTALAIVTLPFAGEDKMEALMLQLMSGALEVLNQAGAALVGGHTSEGSELSLGFAINGLALENAILRKSGMQEGDLLILTRPLGTGVLFAANMRHLAKGRWIAKALDAMQGSSKEAAACFMAHGATACTDITGFGFAGHLMEMAQASKVDVQINLSNLPVYEGALQLIQADIKSTLHENNQRIERYITNHDSVSDQIRYQLLFDPQTAGGLLASVPEQFGQECVESLVEAGYDKSAIVGQVMGRTNGIRTLRVNP